MENAESTVSRASRSSGSRSSAASLTLAAATARAKAEAAQARAAFAKKEIEIKLEKARLEATLHALEKEGEAQAAAAEAAVMEDAAARLETTVEHYIHLPSLQSAHERTAEYIRKHSEPSIEPSDKEPREINTNDIKLDEGMNKVKIKESDRQHESVPTVSKDFQPQRPPENSAHNIPMYTTPSTVHNQYYSPAQYHSNDTNELAKYLVRSQLLTSELTKFDDKPENYLAWKSSFTNATESLDLKAGEEIDLLIKSLGPESVKHARRIRAVNINKSPAALQLIWDRLEETYGSPEAIEGALFAKLDQFPKIGPKDHLKLRELSDLLLEINSAMQEGYLHGLSYLDTARGIAPIVEKLPYGLQDRWMMEGSRYKQEYKVNFPPFTFFLQFIQTQAKARNDPSFHIQPSFISGVKKDRFGENYSNNRRTVSVHETSVTATPTNEPDKWCPVHNRPHALQHCRGFKEKPLQERKRLLKQHNICYKCCASTRHVARNCEAAVKCSECDSDEHPSALHPDSPSLPLRTSLPPAYHGGEQEDGQEETVVASCTEARTMKTRSLRNKTRRLNQVDHPESSSDLDLAPVAHCSKTMKKTLK
ncbi:uncharacterized protein LOC133636154 isoform X3 [Entelurus aequoreus]|uniref:uncharacterized protein LOC133636154 isoform X3 n=1 Tax=Entelurus aequoreus TaxID=161455 RepID=UPI002B1DC631|nr:uncharacterized protein LOC133636154 isoform X3 [Entelurus aequoreus]